MTVDSASTFLVGSILYSMAFVVIIAGITFINNLLSKYWKPVKIWTPAYFGESQRFATAEEMARVVPTLHDEK
jgi:uncharacterized membrane protein YagU involved in acid resistance